MKDAKVREILKKLATGGFLSGSCDTDTAIEKTLRAIKAEVEGERKGLVDALEEIKDLVSWHYDADADPDNALPEDVAAHVNGLVVKVCDTTLSKIEGNK